jgi:hypothetical protein
MEMTIDYLRKNRIFGFRAPTGSQHAEVATKPERSFFGKTIFEFAGRRGSRNRRYHRYCDLLSRLLVTRLQEKNERKHHGVFAGAGLPAGFPHDGPQRGVHR